VLNERKIGQPVVDFLGTLNARDVPWTINQDFSISLIGDLDDSVTFGI
jgi:hypothetical protein